MPSAMDTSEPNNTDAAVRINGNLMGNYIGSKAIIFGFVHKNDQAGRLTLKTTDEEFIQVTFAQPPNNLPETGSLIEALGEVVTRNSFKCIQYSFYSPDVAQKFDTKVYNQFIQCFMEHNHHINIAGPEDETIESVLKSPENDFVIDWALGASQNDTLNETMN